VTITPITDGYNIEVPADDDSTVVQVDAQFITDNGATDTTGATVVVGDWVELNDDGTFHCIAKKHAGAGFTITTPPDVALYESFVDDDTGVVYHQTVDGGGNPIWVSTPGDFGGCGADGDTWDDGGTTVTVDATDPLTWPRDFGPAFTHFDVSDGTGNLVGRVYYDPVTDAYSTKNFAAGGGGADDDSTVVQVDAQFITDNGSTDSTGATIAADDWVQLNDDGTFHCIAPKDAGGEPCSATLCNIECVESGGLFEYTVDGSNSILPTGGSMRIVANGTTYVPTAGVFTIPEGDVVAENSLLLLEVLDSDGNVKSTDCAVAPACPATAVTDNLEYFSGGPTPCVLLFQPIASYHDPMAPVYNGSSTNAPTLEQHDLTTYTLTNPNSVGIEVKMTMSQAHNVRADSRGAGQFRSWGTTQRFKIAEVTDPWLYDMAVTMGDPSVSLSSAQPHALGFCNNRFQLDSIAGKGFVDFRQDSVYSEAYDLDADDFYQLDANFSQENWQHNHSSSASHKEETLFIPANGSVTVALNVYLMLTRDMILRSDIANNFNAFMSSTAEAWFQTNPFEVPTDDPAYDRAAYAYFRWHGSRGICFSLDQSKYGLLPATVATGTIDWTTAVTGAGL
jgi:hypothetical protein